MSRTDPETIGQKSLDTAVIKCTVRDEPERTSTVVACSLPAGLERSSLLASSSDTVGNPQVRPPLQRIETYVAALAGAPDQNRAVGK